jgi:hypothetical protein
MGSSRRVDEDGQRLIINAMPNKISITPDTMKALNDVRIGRPVSNTMGRKLAKLGWVVTRVTKVYGAEPRKILHFHITNAGRAALSAAFEQGPW